jgi:hypothetical protein
MRESEGRTERMELEVYMRELESWRAGREDWRRGRVGDVGGREEGEGESEGE